MNVVTSLISLSVAAFCCRSRPAGKPLITLARYIMAYTGFVQSEVPKQLQFFFAQTYNNEIIHVCYAPCSRLNFSVLD